MKRKGFEASRIAEIHVKNATVPRAGAPQGSRLCLQLLDAPPPPPQPVEATIDGFPFGQMVGAIERAGSNGVLSVELRDGTCCAHKQFDRLGRELLKPSVSGQEILCQKEIRGRGLAYRYFTKATAL